MAYKPVGADENGNFPPRVEAKLKETFVSLVNVKKYGAKGDGVTNDTPAINAAIAAIKASMNLGTNGVSVYVPPTLYFPAGTYKCSTALTTIDFKYLTMTGDGMEASVLHWDGTGPLISLGTFTSAGGFGGAGINFTMQKMQVLSPANIFLVKEGTRPGIAIQDNGSGGVTLDHVKLRGFKYGFMGAYASDFDSFVRPHITNCDVGLYLGPGSQQVRIDTPNFEYNRESLVIDGAAHGSVESGWFVLNSYSDVTIEANAVSRGGVSGGASAPQYGTTWTFSNMWHETDADGSGSRNMPRAFKIQGNFSASLKGIKIIDPYFVSGGPVSENAFLEVDSTGVPVSDVTIRGLTLLGVNMGYVVKNTAGLNNMVVDGLVVADGYAVPPIYKTKTANLIYRDSLYRYVRGAGGGAYTELRDNTGSGDTRTRLVQNADTSLSVWFWTGSAMIERLRFDTQNSRIMYGTTQDSQMGRVAAKVMGVGADQGLRSGVFTTALRPSASAFGLGTTIYDSTLSQYVSSDGTSWRNAAGVITPIATKTGNYTAVDGDGVIVTNGATVTVTLPDPTLVVPGRTRITVKNINAAASTVASAGTSKTLDGTASQSLAQWAKATYVSDGTQWLTV